MIRRILVTVVSVSFLLAGLALAQNPPGGGDEDPPVRLKKKNRPNVAEKPQDELKPEDPPKDPPKDPKKKEEPKAGDEPPAPGESDMDESEVLNRVGKNMRSSEDRLDRAELNDSTRQVQDDILKDLDSLINQEKNGGGGDDQKQDQNDQQNQNDQKNQTGKSGQDGKAKIGMASRKRSLKGGQSQARRGQNGKKPGGQGNGPQQANSGRPGGNQPQGQKPSDQQANAGQPGGNQPQTNPGGNSGPSATGGMGGQSSGPESSKLAEIYKEEWGHLPETLRAPMDAHSREKFMAKYNDLIKQYYITVAEKSRKKD